MIKNFHPHACLCLLLALLVLTPRCPADPPATTQAVNESAQMEGYWADLEKAEPWSSRALLDFYDQPAKTVAFFKEHLKPLKIDQTELDSVLEQLGSDDEKIWRPAFEKLRYFDPRLNVDLQTLISNATESPLRNRLIEVLCDSAPDRFKGQSVSLRSTGGDGAFNFSDNQSSWWAESKVSRLVRVKKTWQRADRAIILLQHIGSPDAIALLKDLATGHPDAEPTVVAKVALESLGAAGK